MQLPAQLRLLLELVLLVCVLSAAWQTATLPKLDWVQASCLHPWSLIGQYVTSIAVSASGYTNIYTT